MRLAAAALLALLLASPALAADDTKLTEAAAERTFLRHDKVADWLDSLSGQGPHGRRGVPQEDAGLARARLVGQGRGDRHRHCRRPHGPRRRGVDRPAGGVEDGARLRRGVRRQDAQRGRRLARVLRGIPARARRLPPAVLAAQPRPARPAVLLDLAALLQRRRHLHERSARVPAARLPARAHGLDRFPGPARGGRPAALAGLGPGGGDRLPRRVQDRAQRHPARAERDRRRLLRRHRRAPDRGGPVAVRPLSGLRRQAEGVRDARRRGRSARPHPDERPLRVRERAWRHVRPSLVPRVRARATWCSAGAGSGTAFRPLT